MVSKNLQSDFSNLSNNINSYEVSLLKTRIFFSSIILLCCIGAYPVFAQEGEVSEQPLTAPTFIKPETAEVPIIMYHLITKNSRYVGKHGITPTELENDLKYLKDNGYETVVISDLIAFVRKGRNLPKKPIVLTFDDSNSSDYRYLYPLLQKYDMKAVLSVLGYAVDECTELSVKQKEPRIFPNSTWGQLKEMGQSKYIELQNHSYNLHGATGSARRKGESVENYHKRLKDDLTKMQHRIEEMTGIKPTAFTYPYGLISESSHEVLKELGFTASLSCYGGIINFLKENDLDCLFCLKRTNRPSGVPISTILQKMQKPWTNPE